MSQSTTIPVPAWTLAAVRNGATQVRVLCDPQPSEYVPGPNVHEPKHDAAYFDAHCNALPSNANPRGMSQHWCWWTPDNRQGPDWIACPFGSPGDTVTLTAAGESVAVVVKAVRVERAGQVIPNDLIAMGMKDVDKIGHTIRDWYVRHCGGSETWQFVATVEAKGGATP
jgi:hypothetical protein